MDEVYVKRDDMGRVVLLSHEPGPECRERVAADNPAVAAFLKPLTTEQSQLDATDQDLVRVLEDVVDLLIAKGVILFTELPESAQEKIINRQRLRSQLGAALDLLGED
ncbi:MAG: tryptophan synthase subunit beta like protein [Pseudomonadota bacterium]